MGRIKVLLILAHKLYFIKRSVEYHVTMFINERSADNVTTMLEKKEYELQNLLPKDQCERVFNQKDCDIDFEFLGFTETYRFLSLIIPEHFTVIDLGCAYAPQSFYFQEHKLYVGVDCNVKETFSFGNSVFLEKTISDFIRDDIHKYNLKETFAICSYVPDWDGENKKIVREAFQNCFVYYPHGGKLSDKIKNLRKRHSV